MSPARRGSSGGRVLEIAAALSFGLVAAGVVTASVVATPPAYGAEPPAALAENHTGAAAATPTHGSATEHAAPGEAAAEHEGDQPPALNLKTLALQLLNFGVLLFVLVKFGGSAINKALAARHQQLKADLASAAELHAAAQAKLAKQEARLVSLEHEIADMRRGIKAEADAEKARLIAAAEQRADRIKSETAFLVDQQVREAEVRLRRESAETALKVAEDILRRAIGAADQQRLLETFVADIEQIDGTGTPGAAEHVS